MCVAYSINGSDPVAHDLMSGAPPEELLAAVRDPEALVYAHNAAFERLIWRDVCVSRMGWPEIPDTAWRCSMAAALAMALPGSLDALSVGLHLTEKKDKAGHRVMKRMCAPDEDGVRFWTREAMDKLLAYCAQDVRAEMELWTHLRPLTEREQCVWEMDQRINDRGVLINVDAANGVLPIIQHELSRLGEEMAVVTGGAVTGVSQVKALTEYLIAIHPEIKALNKESVQAANEMDLSPEAREALDIRLEGCKASTAKLKAMLAGAQDDGRARGLFQYHGASTGRWAGRRIQLQNMPRQPDKFHKRYDDVFEIFAGRGDAQERADLLWHIHGPPLAVISNAVRGFLIAPPGKSFVACDFSSIEARLTAWAANDVGLLDVFRSGACVYCYEAENIFRVEHGTITKKDPRRQIGKVAVLSLGYGGGVNAFRRMGANYGLKMPEDQAAEVVAGWRCAHPLIAGKRDPDTGKATFYDADFGLIGKDPAAHAIFGIWTELETLAKRAIENPGVKITGGAPGRRYTFVKTNRHLWFRMPSGRLLCYPFAALANDSRGRKVIEVFDKNPRTGRFEMRRTWGGTIFENLIQALARDLLVDFLMRCETDMDQTLVMHVHDEGVSEVDDELADIIKQWNEELASKPAHWCPDLPLGAEAWVGKEYRK